MKKITVLYFDNDTPKEEICNISKDVKQLLGEDNGLIALPKNFDLLLDCSVDQLLQVRAMIDTTIEVKLSEDGFDNNENDIIDMPNYQKTKYSN